MSKALIAGINQVATDKGLDREVIFQAIEIALVSAYKRNYGSVANVSSAVDRVSGDMQVFAEREVVEEVMNPRTEITEGDARKTYPLTKLGDVVLVPTVPADFGRIAAQTAKQVILQRIREAERDTVFENFAHQVGEIISTQVRSIDALSGAVTVVLGEKHEVLMMRDDLIASEKLKRNDFIKVLVVDVHKSNRGPVIKLSRTHRNLLRRLMEQEIPEVRDGVVEIKAIAREPGARSKVAVLATVPGIDPVGSCVGMRGLRIQNIVNELAGEKIDVIEYNTEATSYITNALSPAKVSRVLLDESGAIKTAVVIVPDRQLSLAIGKEGQNARLAAKLTGWRIDIKSESETANENFDRLLSQQVQRQGSGEDLLSVAERILRGGEPSDRLSLAARSLGPLIPTGVESMESFGTELETPARRREKPATRKPSEGDLFSDLGEGILPDLPSEPSAAALSFEKALQAVQSTLPEKSIEAAIEDEVPEMKPVVIKPVEAKPVDVKPIEAKAEPVAVPEAKAAPGALPQVITADMLRARMAERKKQIIKTEDIPAELLVGMEDMPIPEAILVDEDEVDPKATGKKGAAAKPAKKKKKRRTFGNDDDYSTIY